MIFFAWSIYEEVVSNFSADYEVVGGRPPISWVLGNARNRFPVSNTLTGLLLGKNFWFQHS
jgi:3'-phosphoadenosine 5'-phosphosulfate sulfotransferase